MKTGEWTLRSRRVVTPSGILAADVVIRNELIVAVAEHDGPEAEGVILDVGDLVVLPGLVALNMDATARPDWPGYEATTRAAGSGGVTTLVNLPADHHPESNSPSAFKARMKAVEGKIRVDCGLVVGLGRGNADLVESWIEAGVIGIEAFLGSSEGTPHTSTEADLRAAMATLSRLGRPLFLHSGRAGRPSRPAGQPDSFGSSLGRGEFEALRLVIRLCRESKCHVHLIRPTAAEALPMIAEARAEGLPLTVETCPLHLGLSVDELVDGVPTFDLDPRGRRRGPDERERLWEGLQAGLIDAIGSGQSRAPEILAPGAPGEVRPAGRGDASLGIALPAVWAEARRRGLGMDSLARWMAGNTAEAFGLSNRKGSIAPGLDADFVVFDPDSNVDDDPGPSDRGRTSPPREGRLLCGRVEATILRGSLISQAGRFHDRPRGAVVLRLEDTQPIHGVIA
jgi:allantoinase